MQTQAQQTNRQASDPWAVLRALEAEQSAHPSRLRDAATRGDAVEARRLLDRAALLPTLIENEHEKLAGAALVAWRDEGRALQERLTAAIAEQQARYANVERLARELETARNLLDGQQYEVRSIRYEIDGHARQRPGREA